MRYDDQDYSPRQGFYRPFEKLLESRRRAAGEVLRTFDHGPDLERLPLLREAAEVLAHVFFTVRDQSKSDWFLTSGMIGHPTRVVARASAGHLQRVARACECGYIDQVTEHLSRIPDGPARLENFLDCSRADAALVPADHARWVYLVRNEAEWGIVNLGEINGRVQDALWELEEINPDLGRYGIMAAWRVLDLRAGYAIAAMVLQPSFIQTDFYDFRDFTDLASMRKQVTVALHQYRLLDTTPAIASPSPGSQKANVERVATEGSSDDDEVEDVWNAFTP
ncbi:hypothetical protein [Rhizobium leguminosarum]|uniref:hypothetical protein n=1 Tax=Rhizobium leguminosarum TaxID=384 RepID=UPI001C9760CF|nr:hypothetical protein [Rhizobium leguminosarum]MBY5346067.1 hypothetical protein [Rhizobium leguminosarum]